MGTLTVAQRFEVMNLSGEARALKYMELSARAPETSFGARAYRAMCRLLYANLYIGTAFTREQEDRLVMLAEKFDFSPRAVDEEIYTWGLGGYGSPSKQEDFLLDLWARREIAVRYGFQLDRLTPQQEDWIARFSVFVSERKRGTQNPPELPTPRRTNTFNPQTPFPDEEPF